jgi:hypothetical protein
MVLAWDALRPGGVSMLKLKDWSLLGLMVLVVLLAVAGIGWYQAAG